MMPMNARDTSGFTLVELMITVAVSIILLGAVVLTFQAQQRSTTAQQDLSIIQQDLRAAMQLLTRDIRMAGYDPTGTENFGFSRNTTFNNGGALSENVSTTSQTLAITSDLDGDGNLDRTAEDIDGNGTIDLREIEQIAYRFNAAANRLEKYSSTTGVVEWQNVANNIQALEFWFELANGLWTLAPNAAQMNDIRSIRISILARADYYDSSFTDTFTYQLGSGAILGPFNDHFRKRLLTHTIQCRNRGG